MNFIKLIATLKENKAFFGLYLGLLLLGAYPFVAFDKVTFLLMLNAHHHPILDHFFSYITWLGSGLTYGLLLVFLLWIRVGNRKILIGISSFVVMAVLIQLMKRILFPDQLRPIALIPATTSLHLIKHIVLDSHFSFPSGHAGTIFTASCFINLITPKKSLRYSCLLLLLASLVSYSRIYLCQHFYTDVYVGGLIGVGSTTWVYGLLMDWKGPMWLDKHRLISR